MGNAASCKTPAYVASDGPRAEPKGSDATRAYGLAGGASACAPKNARVDNQRDSLSKERGRFSQVAQAEREQTLQRAQPQIKRPLETTSSLSDEGASYRMETLTAPQRTSKAGARGRGSFQQERRHRQPMVRSHAQHGQHSGELATSRTRTAEECSQRKRLAK